MAANHSKLKQLREQADEAKTREQWAFDNQYDIYQERDLLVATLARLWPSHLMQHSHSPHSRGRRLVVCIHSPVGKLSWTVPNNMLDLYQPMCQSGENDYDKCKVDEKRARLENYARKTHCAFPPDATPLRKTT